MFDVIDEVQRNMDLEEVMNAETALSLGEEIERPAQTEKQSDTSTVHAKKKKDEAWMREILSEAERRDLDEDVLSKLVDAVRLSHDQTNDVAPEKRQCVVGDFLRPRT